MTTVPKTDLNLSELKTIGCQQYVMSKNWACVIQHSNKHKKIIMQLKFVLLCFKFKSYK